jgi:gliding motility-associated-like protein/uncharacterized repeat protein (TIGR01451 family)
MLKSNHPFRLMVFTFCVIITGFLQPLYAQDDRNGNGGGGAVDLVLTKQADRIAARVGSRIIFTIKLKNTGLSKTDDVTVSDLLPSGFSFISSSNPQDYNPVTGEWEVEDLRAGDSTSLQLVALVNLSNSATNYTNIAFIADKKNKDPQPLNDTAKVKIEVYDFTVTSSVICAQSAAALTASAVNVVNPVFRWYADQGLSQLLFTGANFATSKLETNQVFYVTVGGDNIPPDPNPLVAAVSVLPSPVAPQLSLVQPTCSTASGSITITAPLLAGFLYSVDGISFANASGVFSGLSAGTYNVYIKSPNGCVSASTQAVLNAQPLTPATPSLSVVQPTCSNGAGKITVSSPRNAGYRFSINGVDFSDSTGVFTNLLPGTYTVSVKEMGGCISGITTAVIEQNPLVPAAPVVAVTQPACPSQTGSITITSPVGTGYTYSLDGNTFINQTGVFTSLVPATYSIYVKNADGCVSAATAATINLPVVNEPKLTITAAGSTQICSGGSVVLTAGEAESYQWYKYGIALAGAQSQTYTAISEGVFTVSRRSNTGCLSQQSEGILVTVAQQPTQPVLYAERRSICAGDSAVLIAGTPAPLQWFRDGVLIDGENDYTLVVKRTGVYTVKSVSTLGCTSLQSNPVLLQVLDRPDQPSVELIQPDCFNRGIIKIKSPLASGYLYSIDGVTYTNTSGSFIGMADGTYHVAVKAANGCVSKHTQVTIQSTPINDTLLTITPGSSTQLCPGGSVVLTASNAGTYQWYQNGIAVAGANMQTYTVSGDGVFAVSRRNEGRCIYPQSMGVPVRIVQPPAAPVIAAPKQLICAGETIVIQSSQAFALQWFRNGQPIAGANAVQLQVQASGTYVAQAANSAGCSSTFSNPVVVTVIDLPVTPVLEIDGTTQFCKDETRLLKVKSIPPAHTIQWFRNNTLIPGVFSDTLRINDGAGYRVTLTNSNGCASTPSNTVLTAVVCVTGIYVPDVFTPNGDGINDIIKPITPGIRKFRWFRIYNRWGNLVFEAADAQKGWDGKFRGKEQPAETYIWVVEGADSRGISIKKTGMLNLVR